MEGDPLTFSFHFAIAGYRRNTKGRQERSASEWQTDKKQATDFKNFLGMNISRRRRITEVVGLMALIREVHSLIDNIFKQLLDVFVNGQLRPNVIKIPVGG